MKRSTIIVAMILVLVALVAVQFYLNDAADMAPAEVDLGEGAIMAPNDPEMQQAYNKARKSLDYFFGLAESPPRDAERFSVKVGIEDDGVTEFFWIYPFEQEEEGYSGRINEEPELVESVFKGQVIEFDRKQIVDWTFEDTATETMHGNYTGCVRLEREAPENAAQFQELYGLDCDK